MIPLFAIVGALAGLVLVAGLALTLVDQ